MAHTTMKKSMRYVLFTTLNIDIHLILLFNRTLVSTMHTSQQEQWK